MKNKLIILAITIAASATFVTAQGDKPPRPPGSEGRPGGREGGPGGQGGPGGPGGRMNPIVEALDLNKDGIIDADELAKASESLKKLDKNNDGKLTEDEFRPQRPAGQGGPDGRGQGRPPGGEKGGPGGESRPQRPEIEK